ncbi:MAG: YdiL family protein [Burkholderiaceae bacterium]|nr:YdiL family protein [Burkholderiaceae bacterium]
MKPHELEALRRLLFFSQSEAAKLCEVSEKTLRRWEFGRLPVPDDVFAFMRRLVHLRQQMIDARIAEFPGGARVCLIWYESDDDWRGRSNCCWYIVGLR